MPTAEASDEWTASDPMDALSAADLNRMGVLQAVHFAYDSDSVGSTQRSVIEANAAWLRENPNARIIVEGHCDERGTRRYNLDLGERRAEAARSALVQLGVDPQRIEVVSYGEELPSVEASNESAWQANRRADFVIVAIDR
ncbi:MAG: peptidoglycan-associated lipoprotein Pal [Acidobacteria bacterium]|nr:peptidoglycan-associated lipoprotein Pal [Acidobacteriota bacterium]